MTEMWMLTWLAGPDAGRTVVLGAGEHIVGRAVGAAARCDDAALEPHHLLVEVSAAGMVVRQLTGRVPARINGEPIGEPLTITSPARIEVGHSLLLVAPAELTAPVSALNRPTSRRRPMAAC